MQNKKYPSEAIKNAWEKAAENTLLLKQRLDREREEFLAKEAAEIALYEEFMGEEGC